MGGIIENVSGFVLDTISRSGYAGLFFLSLLENLCLPIPSEVVMPFSGSLVATGRFSMIAVLVVATVANWLGSMIVFYIFRYGGRPLIAHYGKYVRIHQADIEASERWFSRYGAAAVFWARMIPTIRVLVTIPAGIAKMNVKKFALYTFVGSLVWNIFLAYVGYAAGQHWDAIGPYIHKFGNVVLVVIILAIVWYVIKSRQHRK